MTDMWIFGVRGVRGFFYSTPIGILKKKHTLLFFSFSHMRSIEFTPDTPDICMKKVRIITFFTNFPKK